MAQPVEYCEVCGLPPEYCEYGPCFELCKPWLKEHHTDLYPDLANVEFTVDQIQATNNAIEQRTKTTQPSRKNAKKDASAKEVLVSLKSRQKHKYITIITGLDLYDIKIKEACKFFCKKFSCSVSSEKNHSGIQEIHIQGDVKDDVAELMNETYDIPFESMFFVDGDKKTPLA